MNSRFLSDLQYVFLNFCVNKIPSWNIRKTIYRIFGMKIGDGSRIGIGTVVVNPSGIKIGKRSIVNEFCHLDGRGGLKIGNDVSISVYSVILTASHKSDSKDFKYYSSNVTIENNVWLGARAMVLDGSKIKSNSVIGAGCVYKGTAEDNSVYVAAKPRRLRDRQKHNYKIVFNPFFR